MEIIMIIHLMSIIMANLMARPPKMIQKPS